jgi:hypothetical protein
MTAGLALALDACAKPKEQTTPRARTDEGPRPVRIVAKSDGSGMLNCETPAGSRIITLDLNRDKLTDRWVLVDKDGKKLCHEMDQNFDGKRDVTMIYFDDGTTVRTLWWDLDYDGVFDQVMHNRPDGSKERVEIQPFPPKPGEKKGFKPSIWKYYHSYKGKGTLLERVEMDKDQNGYKDYWERYDEGLLKEVSWADPGDTDEKPKHWIEAPEEGQDKGFRGDDEKGEDKPRPAAGKEPARPAAR